MPFFGSLGSFVTLAILVVAAILNAVTTLAGTGVAGFAESPAQFSTPYGVATDWDGNVYVADSANQRIRKITPAGVTTVFAGTGTPQFGDGTGTNASFNYPYAVAVDSSQNVYVSDSINYRIRKITPGGVVTTLAGSGTAATTNGTGAGASFNLPRGITVDLSGNVYVTEQSGHVIRKITSGGVVTTLAGIAGTTGSTDATGTSASFNIPFGVVADSFGNVYVSDTYNHRIRRITSDGIVTTLAGSTVGFADGTGTNAKFNFPETMSIDPLGVLYVAEETGQRIRKITPQGVVTTLAGTGTAGFDNGTALQATFRNPHGIAVDRFRQAYVGDKDNHAIRKIADVYTLPENNGVVTTILTTGINYHCILGRDSIGNLYTWTTQYRIFKITPGGSVINFIGNGTYGAAQDGTGTNTIMSQVFDIVFDSDDNFFFTDYNNHRIRKATPAGVVTTFAGSSSGFFDASGTSALFSYPRGIAIDLSGNLYVTDSGNYRIRKITGGLVTTLAGNGTSATQNGTGTNATFLQPTAITVDSVGNVYVLDGNVIRKITPAGVVTSFAGQATAGFADGTGTNAQFSSSWPDLTIDIFGNLYLSDSSNHRIRRITPAGVVTTLAGNGTAGSTDGIGTNATFNQPYGITIDRLGNLYVSDQLNNRIRKIGTGAVQLPLNRGVTTTFAGSTQGFLDATGVSAQFYGPVGPSVDTQGNLYIGDIYNHRVRKITPAGVVTSMAGNGNAVPFADGTGTNATFYNPQMVGVDTAGNVYVPDFGNNKIRKITPGGVVSTLAGSGSAAFADGSGASASFTGPRGAAVDTAGNVYVADAGNNRIRKITPGGVVSTLAGQTTAGSTNATGTNAQFNAPFGVAVDPAGNVYVADQAGNRVRKITPDGVVTTLAGNGTTTFADGTGTNATFNGPYGVAVDSEGTVYVSDLSNHRVRKISPAGVVTTLAGQATSGSNNATGTNATFNQPWGVGVDSGGIVYVGDFGNHRIRKIA